MNKQLSPYLREKAKLANTITEELAIINTIEEVAKEKNYALQREADSDAMSQHLQNTFKQSKIKDPIQEAKELAAIEDFRDTTLSEYFAALVYKAIPLEESDKGQEDNVAYIQKVCDELYRGSAVNITTSPVFNKANSIVNVALKRKPIDGKLGLADSTRVITSLFVGGNGLMTNEAINLVREKTVEAIRTESTITKNREKALAEGIFVPKTKTLMSTLTESHAKVIIGSYEDSFNESDIADHALAESIIVYTALEMLNTCKLIDLPPAQLREFVQILSTKKFV